VSEENVRSAGVRQTDRQLIGASTADIVKAAKHEIGSTWRVYTKEWLIQSRGTEDEMEKLYTTKYEGRVEEDDHVIKLDDESKTYTLELRLWNVKAEWKTKELADVHAENLAKAKGNGFLVDVVARNSRKEHVLSNYGKLLLPKK
jgi:hypothetical protein